jgi:gamma-butyrobetaine dioxygenase
MVDGGRDRSRASVLVAIESRPDRLEIEWSDRFRSSYHAIWLRDNCRCEDCGVPETGRRKLRLTGLDLDVTVTEAIITPDDRLTILWADGHKGSFGGAWLRANTYDEAARRARCFKPRIWDDGLRQHPPVMDFAAVYTDDHHFLEMLVAVRDLGLCFLRGAPIEAGPLERFASKIGPIQESNFGRVLDLLVDNSKQSVANRTVSLKPHTDEPYRASPPGLLMFHCIEADATGGGASMFVDGFEIAEILRIADPEGFDALSRNSQCFRRHFAGDVDLIAEFPVISVDDFGNLVGLRINDRVAGPLAIPESEMPKFYRGLKRLLALSEDENKMLVRMLQPGDIAIFDNHRILHGRTELAVKGRRWLQTVQVERGDFHSALRIYADKLELARDAAPLLRGSYG